MFRRPSREEFLGHRILRLLRAQPVERCARGNAPRPRLETAFRLEPDPGAIDAPERLDGQFVRRSRIAEDTQNPTAHSPLMNPEERLECRVANACVPLAELDQVAPLAVCDRVQRAARDFAHRSPASDRLYAGISVKVTPMEGIEWNLFGHPPLWKLEVRSIHHFSRLKRFSRRWDRQFRLLDIPIRSR